MRFLRFCVAAFLGTASLGQAATLNESDIAGGFGSSFNSPTVIGSDVTTVTGTVSAADFDFLHFTSLSAGAQTLTFNFNLADPNGLSGFQNGGGSVRIKETAPGWAYDGNPLNPAGGNDFDLSFDPFNVAGAVVSQTLSYSLGAGYAGGDLYVSILPTFASQAFSFGVIVPGNSASVDPSPVPVPAAGLLLIGALGGMAALRRRKTAPLLA